MRKGKKKKTHSALPAVTLGTVTQKLVVMLQRLADILLRLVDGDIFRDQASHPVPTQNNLLTLIRLFLAHNRRDRLRSQLAFFKKLPHTDCLIVGRGYSRLGRFRPPNPSGSPRSDRTAQRRGAF